MRNTWLTILITIVLLFSVFSVCVSAHASLFNWGSDNDGSFGDSNGGLLSSWGNSGSSDDSSSDDNNDGWHPGKYVSQWQNKRDGSSDSASHSDERWYLGKNIGNLVGDHREEGNAGEETGRHIGENLHGFFEDNKDTRNDGQGWYLGKHVSGFLDKNNDQDAKNERHFGENIGNLLGETIGKKDEEGWYPGKLVGNIFGNNDNKNDEDDRWRPGKFLGNIFRNKKNNDEQGKDKGWYPGKHIGDLFGNNDNKRTENDGWYLGKNLGRDEDDKWYPGKHLNSIFGNNGNDDWKKNREGRLNNIKSKWQQWRENRKDQREERWNNVKNRFQQWKQSSKEKIGKKVKDFKNNWQQWRQNRKEQRKERWNNFKESWKEWRKSRREQRKDRWSNFKETWKNWRENRKEQRKERWGTIIDNFNTKVENIVEEEVEVTEPAPHRPADGVEDKYSVIVYGGEGDFTEEEAKRLKESLEKQGYEVTLIDKNNYANEDELHDAFSGTTKDVDADDEFFFYYYQHGGTPRHPRFRDPLIGGDEKGPFGGPLDSHDEGIGVGNTGPFDFSDEHVVTDDEMSDWFNELDPETKQIIMFNSCYSGDIVEDLQGDNRIVMSSTTGPRPGTAPHIPDNEGEPDVPFTYYFSEGLDTGNADLNDDGDITVDEAYRYAEEKSRPIDQETALKHFLSTVPVTLLFGGYPSLIQHPYIDNQIPDDIIIG